MEKLKIVGGNRLSGSISCSGAKNAALPMLAATILTDKPVTFQNLPYLQDITTMFEILGSMGADITLNENMDFIVSTANLNDFEARYELVKTMRASILVLGSLVGKYGFARIALPGGCAIGSRPIDIHLDALKKMKAKIKIKDGYIFASAKRGLKGCSIKFPKISVGATENILIAACFAKGETKLRNCASEPEIADLINFLKKLGCNISQIGKRSINVLGIERLKSIEYKVIFDRIEAGTYIIAAALTKGFLKIKNIDPKIMSTEINLLQKMGVDIIKKKNYLIATRSKKLQSVNVITEPYPGFPTDLQAQIMVLMTKAEGVSTIKENIFENRFMHVSELRRMGAKIETKGNKAKIFGKSKLNGAELMATDLRASVCLVLAGLVPPNKTIINRIYHLDRGYEKIEKRLSKCGARIRRV